MRSVVAKQIILFFQRNTQCSRYGFLTDTEVDGTAHFIGGMVFLRQRAFAAPQPQHEVMELCGDNAVRTAQ